jgi:RNA ligase (TIGR02306 family)
MTEEVKSTHRVEAVRVSRKPAPNSDSLSIVSLFNGGFQVVVRTEDWKDGELGAYVPPDSLVPVARPEFEWLINTGRALRQVEGKEYYRVTAIKLRKNPSMGLLIKAPPDAVEGQDLTEFFGVLHYEPPTKGQSWHDKTRGSQAEEAPELKPPVYDVDSLRRYSEVFVEGEEVYITEKIHGANARFLAEDRGLFSFSRGFHGLSLRFGNHTLSWSRRGGFKIVTMPPYVRWMRVGSRTQWRKPDPNDTWWRALATAPEVAEFCRFHPGMVVYAEVYGDVQDLDYGLGQGEVRLAAFDFFDAVYRTFVGPKVFYAVARRWKIPTVPILEVSKFSLVNALALADGFTKVWHGAETTAPHTREGVVVKPASERHDPRVGRVVLKAVGQAYLERQ